jgi:hypothetical protein
VEAVRQRRWCAVTTERPGQPIIANRAEAWLGVLGRLLVTVGFALGVLWGPAGWAMLLFGVVLIVAYLRRIDRRLTLPRQDRRMLRFWLGTGALYRALLTIRDGNDGTGASPHPR